MTLDHLFGDRGAGLRVAVAAAILGGLGAWYAHWALGAELGWRWAIADPVARDGAAMVFPLWEVTGIDGPERYEISKVVKGVPLVGDARDLRVGDTVSVMGTFDATGDVSGPVVRVTERELHHLRKYKEVLGILGFVFVAAWVPFAFRVQRWKVVERG